MLSQRTALLSLTEWYEPLWQAPDHLLSSAWTLPALESVLSVPSLPAGPANLRTSTWDKKRSILGFTTSLERKQYHYFLGTSIADRGRVRIIQCIIHYLARAPGRLARRALWFLSGRVWLLMVNFRWLSNMISGFVSEMWLWHLKLPNEKDSF